jgi:CRISP-associated protein Cas1
VTNRIIDISETPARLSAQNGLLRIEAAGAEARTIPFSHLAAVVCGHPQVTFTQAVIAELAEAGALLIACDAKRLPVAMILPLRTHHRQTTQFQWQAAAGLPLRKRIWRQIVTAKIVSQSGALARLRGEGGALELMAKRVKTGNATQMESLASRYYWPLLFGDAAYRRGEEEDSRNALLDYGYAVVRAIVARALCGAGLHPALALHHHNQYDPYPLANDMMEPFRPLVDEWVAGWCGSRPGPWPLDRESKSGLLSRLSDRFTGKGEDRTLFDWAERAAEQLARCLDGSREDLEFPELCCGAESCSEAHNN